MPDFQQGQIMKDTSFYYARSFSRSQLTLVSAAIILACAVARADVRLPAIFGDHMVLQRNFPVPVWGWADPGETVTSG